MPAAKEIDRRHLHPEWQQQVRALLSRLSSEAYRQTRSGLYFDHAMILRLVFFFWVLRY